MFSDELAEPSWNLLARELSMIMFNPRHPAVIAAGLSLKPAPANPATVISELSHLRRMARWAEANGLPPQLADWQRQTTCDASSTDLREQLSNNSIRQLHRNPENAAPVRSRPDRSRTAKRPLARQERPRSGTNLARRAVVSTPVIPPEQWFPLIRAAWTYVHTFAPDILRAQQRYQELLDQTTPRSGGPRRATGPIARRPHQPHPCSHRSTATATAR